jgi:RHS repeat-associated protein
VERRYLPPNFITDANGALQESYSFDAWGKRRAINSWNPLSAADIQTLYTNTDHTTNRGYTGHEQMYEVGLIHMNGRIYDPMLGRVLQADPVIDGVGSTQGYNRYSYVHNNPLAYTDPSGFSRWTKFRDKWLKPIAAIAVTFYMGPHATAFFQSALLGGAATGFVAGAITTGTLRGAAIGAFSGAMFAGIGDMYAGKAMDFGARVFKTILHGIAGGVGSVLSGGKFGHGFASAGFTQAASLGGRTFVRGDTLGNAFKAAVIGGTASTLTGGKFANGATTAAFSYMFGDMARRSRQRNPTFQEGKGGVAFVGGFFDKTIHGPLLQAYEAYAGDKAYFQWYESEALGQWIDANGGNASVIGHSYGADMAAEVVAAGHSVNALRTVDPVGWTRPNFANVAANSGSWVNYNAVGGGATWPNFVAGIGGAWNNAPSSFLGFAHRNVTYDHAGVCSRYCSP